MSAIQRSIAALVTLLALSACQEDGPLSSTAEEPPERPDLLAMEKLSCERGGGTWGTAQGRDSAFVCYRPLRDAGKTCSAADDCSGLCLARSRSCSPVEPFFGCHEVLLKGGQQATLCID